MNTHRTPPPAPSGTGRWHTHDVTLHPDRVVKRFRAAEGPGPYERERRALTLLGRHAPGVAPALLSARAPAHAGDPPTLVMSRLPGTPLRGNPLTERQLAAWAQTVRTLHAALPPDELARLPLRHGHQRDTVARVRAWYATPPQRGLAPTVRAAIRAGRSHPPPGLPHPARPGLALPARARRPGAPAEPARHRGTAGPAAVPAARRHGVAAIPPFGRVEECRGPDRARLGT
ncbi:aminoglycoside phosphotransferase family protein [Streptomyces sp. A1-5]|uniref:aminoglycoside phosphotransferase family protein n=1 Tax=Streptomyces sp. A1-5 TaxID=2738410 RepID=UPI001F2B97C4|nr:aminoglycoside phosphotransferase family protein [Streptomyces sp. A1-5]